MLWKCVTWPGSRCSGLHVEPCGCDLARSRRNFVSEIFTTSASPTSSRLPVQLWWKQEATASLAAEISMDAVYMYIFTFKEEQRTALCPIVCGFGAAVTVITAERCRVASDLNNLVNQALFLCPDLYYHVCLSVWIWRQRSIRSISPWTCVKETGASKQEVNDRPCGITVHAQGVSNRCWAGISDILKLNVWTAVVMDDDTPVYTYSEPWYIQYRACRQLSWFPEDQWWSANLR